MLLSSGAIIICDMINAIQRPKSSVSILRGRHEHEGQDEVSALVTRVARAVRRPTGLRMIETEAAETILITALAAHGQPMSVQEGHQAEPDAIRNVLRDPNLIRFVENHLVYASSRTKLRRADLLTEFQNMVTVLDRAAEELK